MKGIENVSLVKEQSNPAVFLIVGDTKFWIVDPNEFNTLGFDWSKVRVVDDGTLSSFTQQLLHASPATRPSDVFIDCGQDHDELDGKHYRNCQPSTSIVRKEVLAPILVKDVLVAGWLTPHDQDPDVPHVNNNSKGKPGIEDIFYDIILDATFLDRMYGPNGLSAALQGAVWPGNPPTTAPQPFDYVEDAQGKPLHQDFNSWILPGGSNQLHVELNAWHTQTTGGLFHTHLDGRGLQPTGWVNPLSQDTDAWFPFHPLDPEGIGQPLKQGDYVVMRGVLFQDIGHDPANTTTSVWGLSFDGWGEIHPPDWIVRVKPPGPNARLTTSVLAITPPSPPEFSIYPDFPPSSPGRVLRVRSRSIQQLLDSRFIFPPESVLKVQNTPDTDHVVVHVVIQQTQTQITPIFKASWLVGWSEIDGLDQVWWVDDQLPAGATLAGNGEGWNWNADNVFFGKLSHVSVLAPGMHQHYFLGATTPMTVTASDNLFAMVYLDPDSPPDEVMLQWHTSDWLSRAYWGENLLNVGTDESTQRYFMGPLPRTGEWIRLEVPASFVGLGGASQVPSKVDGMAFTLSGGSATWDYVGVYQPKADAAFISQNMTSVLPPGQTFPATVTMKNTGLSTWVASGNAPYLLGAQNPQDNTTWRLNRVNVPTNVPPGASVTFNFTVTAPAQPGDYNFQWRMVNEAVGWFGDFTPNVLVSVGSTITVPNLVGRTTQDAEAIAQQAGFVMSISKRTVVKNLKDSTVVNQYTAPGTLALKGSTIAVDIDMPAAGP